MQFLRRDARAIAAALAAVACVLTGCATTEKSAGTATAPANPNAGSLNPEELRKSEALAHYATGRMISGDKGEEAALQEFRKTLELDPHNTTLSLQLAQAYLTRRDVTNAIAIMEAAVKSEPHSSEAWYGMGVVEQRNENTTKAIAAWRQALKADPANANATRALVEVFMHQGTVTDIMSVVQPALKQNSKDPLYWVSIGETLSTALRQQPSLAGYINRTMIRQCCEKALALAPNDVEVLARVADVYADSGDYELASGVYTKALKARPGSSFLLDRALRTYLRTGQKEAAATTLEQIAKRDPRSEIYSTLGDLYEEMGKTDRALTNYRRSLEMNPNQLNLYVHIALGQMRLRKFTDANATLAAAKAKFPTKYQVPYLAGLLQTDQKQYTNAVASFVEAEKLAQEEPDDNKPTTAFYFSYGAACERVGEEERAVGLFRKAIELDPENDKAYNYLGYMWADKGVHLDESMEMIQKALKLDPDNGAYLDSLGWVLYRMGKYEEALPALQRAIEQMKKDEEQDDSTVLDHLAETYLKLGKREQAVDAWRRALKADPDNKDIAGKLQKYSDDHTAAPTSSAAQPVSPTR